jgi:HNH endonuclease
MLVKRAHRRQNPVDETLASQMSGLHTATALKLHAFGLQRLQDPNWTGMDLYDKLKQHVRGRVQPIDLLRKPLERGLAYQIGFWLFDDFFDRSYIEDLPDEYRVWYLEDLLEFLNLHGVSVSAPSVVAAKELLSRVSDLYGEGGYQEERKYYEFLDSEEGIAQILEAFDHLKTRHGRIIERQKPFYAADYADRVFHDRQLCEYLAGLVIRIGFDGDDDDEGVPKRWVKRERWPAWVVNMLRSRDRGDCAKCGKQLIKECKGTPHIDHIFPLVKGGCNDLVNLQLLCDRCNGRKKARLDPVKNSVPDYIRRHLER